MEEERNVFLGELMHIHKWKHTAVGPVKNVCWADVFSCRCLKKRRLKAVSLFQ